MMEAARTSETLVNFYQTTRCYNPEDSNLQSASNMWLKRLRKCHESLSLRKPEATSLTQATIFNHENVKVFFENLIELMSRHKFSANKIYNLDETGNAAVHVPLKIICAKEIKQIGNVTSGERGINVTVIVAVNDN
jgi:hypothetical protein